MIFVFRPRRGVLRPSRRAAALLEWIAAEKLEVERLVRGWPMRGNERKQSRAELEALVASSKR